MATHQKALKGNGFVTRHSEVPNSGSEGMACPALASGVMPGRDSLPGTSSGVDVAFGMAFILGICAKIKAGEKSRTMKFLVFCLFAICFLGCSVEKTSPSKDQIIPSDMTGLVEITEFDYALKSDVGSLEFRYSEVLRSGVLLEGKKHGVWKTYDEEGRLIEALQYKKDSLQFVLDKDDFTFRMLKVPNYKFSIYIPSGWIEEKAPDGILFNLSKPEEALEPEEQMIPNISLMVVDLPTGVAFEEYVGSYRNALKNQTEDFKEVSFVRDTISGLEAFRETFVYIDQEGMGIGGMITWLLTTQNEVFFLSCHSYNGSEGWFLKYKELFREISESVVVVQSTRFR